MKLVWWVLILAILIQVVPFGHSHTNPAVTKEPGWDSSDTASSFTALATTATVIRQRGHGIRTWRPFPGSFKETSTKGVAT